jgi:4-carboxymuconolactone decarboxylase
MRILIWIGLSIAAIVTASGQAEKGTTAAGRSAALPADVHADSLNRLPLIKREQMDENGKKVYDLHAGGAGKMVQRTGPSSISLYSPGVAEPLRRLNDYLRRKNSLLGDQVTELAILVAAREMDSNYVWSAHEPTAQKVGVPQAAIDAVKFGKPVAGLGEKETVVISLARQLFHDHKVTSPTFAKAVDLFGKQGTVELVAVMGDYIVNSMLLNAWDQHLPPERKPLLPPR